jgi:hypothetical protein
MTCSLIVTVRMRPQHETSILSGAEMPLQSSIILVKQQLQEQRESIAPAAD